MWNQVKSCLHVLVIKLQLETHLLCCFGFANQDLLCTTLRIFWALGLNLVTQAKAPCFTRDTLPYGFTSSHQTHGALWSTTLFLIDMNKVYICLYDKSLHWASKHSYSTMQTCGVILLLINSCVQNFYFQLHKLWQQPSLLQNRTLPCLTDWFREHVRNYFSVRLRWFFFKYRQVVKSCLAVWKLVTKSYYQGIRKEEGEQDKGIFQS